MIIRKKTSKKKIWLLAGLAVVALAAAVLAFLEFTDRIFLFHERPQLTGANQYTKGEPKTPTSSTGSSTQSGDAHSNADQSSGSSSDTKATQGNATSDAKLQPPQGTFISSHHLPLSKSPRVESNCTTTPGANCVITFTKDGAVKQLPPKNTDAGGSAFWEWTPQDIGLTEGTWRIQAVAKLGSQTQTADDALALEVNP